MIQYLTVSETNKLQSAYQICFCRKLTLTWHLCAPSISLWSDSFTVSGKQRQFRGYYQCTCSVTVWLSNSQFFNAGFQETRNWTMMSFSRLVHSTVPFRGCVSKNTSNICTVYVHTDGKQPYVSNQQHWLCFFVFQIVKCILTCHSMKTTGGK